MRFLVVWSVLSDKHGPFIIIISLQTRFTTEVSLETRNSFTTEVYN